MRFLNVALCIFVLSVVCVTEETEYFDKEGLKLYASRNYT
jgi:hypothetical protein